MEVYPAVAIFSLWLSALRKRGSSAFPSIPSFQKVVSGPTAVVASSAALRCGSGSFGKFAPCLDVFLYACCARWRKASRSGLSGFPGGYVGGLSSPPGVRAGLVTSTSPCFTSITSISCMTIRKGKRQLLNKSSTGKASIGVAKRLPLMPSIAAFAILSAVSFLSIPTCERTHCRKAGLAFRR